MALAPAAAADPRGATAGLAGNRLAGETSAYLRGAARQPVAWQPWGDEAFALARRLGRPILLDIGAAWCTWCHVMDAESYEDPAIAESINRAFVPVKVDRDARPDIDRRYQAAVSAAFGVSGWPLTVVLTPAGEVIFGGTYFPPTDRDGRAGLTTVLCVVAESWRDDPDTVLGRAAAIAAQVARAEAVGGAAVAPALRARVRAAILADYDFAHGGFPARTSAQFPRPVALRFLLRSVVERGDAEAREALVHTLDAMALGALRDHLGGGFHRYTVDRAWRVPHFEMLAATNAELLRLYLQAWQATGAPLYREVVEETLRFVRERLADPGGGFWSSLDADGADGVEGSPYTWRWAELARVLTPAELEVARAVWGLAEWPDRLPDQPDRNVLAVVGSLAPAARAVGPEAETRTLLDAARAKLRAARARRPPPATDRARYADASAAMITAWLEAGLVLDRAALRAFALRSLDRLLRETYRPGRGVSHRPAGAGAWTPGLLDDSVLTAEACLLAYQATRESRYLAIATDVVDTAHRLFWDAARGGFRDRAPVEGQGLLARPARPVQDAAVGGGNGAAAQVLLTLAAVTSEGRYREWAREALAALGGAVPTLGSLGGGYALALDLYLDPPAQVVVVGRGRESRTLDLWRRALAAFRPGKVVLLADAGGPPATDLPGLVREKLMLAGPEAGPTAYVCAGVVCSLPLREPGAMVDAIRTFGTREWTGGTR
ncbi:MAG: hypothetical protein A3F92_02535 [Candidatus Rokubacteria bacterium RIFCSPLOWO2_12_FULL_71_22]|nr:MAG: hypothetical protein A3F92_02535 [Candidatus Rokubacteria bacterium RIFCSPLOWO2_12_FULL_71_22]